VSTGNRTPLTRERILAAALGLADRDGLDGLSMRTVGRALGVEAMSLYRHVANKDDLLDGLVDLVFAEIELPPPGIDWEAAMRGRAVAVREALRRHPWAIALMESRVRPGPANLRHHDAVLAVLLGAGFTAATATRAYNLIDSYVYGFALQETNLPFTTAEELAEVAPAMVAAIPQDLFPNLRRVSEELVASGFDYGAEFEAGLDLILDAIATMPRGGHA
jgi:AcrR family transcriptional regulator